MYHIKNDEGAQALAAAIVGQACRDYVKYRKIIIKYEFAHSRKKQDIRNVSIMNLRNLLMWFHSEHYGLLCEADPEKLIERLEELVQTGRGPYTTV
jgi:hypothetical protein